MKPGNRREDGTYRWEALPPPPQSPVHSYNKSVKENKDWPIWFLCHPLEGKSKLKTGCLRGGGGGYECEKPHWDFFPLAIKQTEEISPTPAPPSQSHETIERGYLFFSRIKSRQFLWNKFLIVFFFLFKVHLKIFFSVTDMSSPCSFFSIVFAKI